jgi:hypothetical protein
MITAPLVASKLCTWMHCSWREPRTRRKYFQWEAERRREIEAHAQNGGTGPAMMSPRDGPREISNGAMSALLQLDGEWQSSEYQKWTPFAHVWDVRTLSPLVSTVPSQMQHA